MTQVKKEVQGNMKVEDRKKRMLLAAIAVVGVLLAVGIHYVVSQHTASSKKNLIPTVATAAVSKADLIKKISLVGQTVPQAQIDVAAKYQGRVTGVFADLGQAVEPGQVLVTEDTQDADLNVMQNQQAYQQASADAKTMAVQQTANYDKASADYHKALASYERNKQVFDVGGITEDALDTSAQQLADAKASLDMIQNQMEDGVPSSVSSAQASAAKAGKMMESAQKQRNDLILTAASSGLIGYRQVEIGDMVSAGQKLMSIYDNRRLYVDCQAAEQDLPAFSLTMPIDVSIDSLGKSITGQVIYISPIVDPTSLMYTVRIAIDNSAGDLKSGMFARALLNSVLRPQALLIPKAAVLEKDGAEYVFVVDDKNKVTQKTIKTGAKGDSQVEILSGLAEGEQVAVTNMSRLRDGLTVQVEAPADGQEGSK